MNASLLRTLALAVAASAACGPVRAEHEPSSRADDAPRLQAVVPRADGPLWPSLADARARVDVAALADVDACASCHADIARQWQGSAHALASLANPWYRVSFDRVHDAVGPDATRFCGGCHDPVPLFDGAMTAQVPPEHGGVYVGVTCATCHTATQVTADGNGGYTLAGGVVPVPRDGDAESLARHIAAMTPAPVRDGSLCISCHRGALGPEVGNVHHLTGVADPGAWSDSTWAGRPFAHLDEPVETTDCVGCHMPEVDGVVSHRFPGGHSLLAAAIGDEDQLEAQRQMLRGAASVHVAAVAVEDAPAVAPPEATSPGAGDRVAFDVVVRNERVGHRFPGGTLDLQDVWLEVSLVDATGRVFARSGADHAADRPDNAWVARAILATADGEPVLTHDTWRFAALAADRTIPARDVRLVRYAAAVPDDVVTPLTVEARLLHRSRSLPLREAACADHRSERGAAFADGLRDARGLTIDPCVSAPITEVASASARLDGTGPVADARSQWLWGRALATDVQESLPASYAVLSEALALAGAEGDIDTQAWVLGELGRVAGRMGRTEEALRWWARAELLRPGHPAIAYGRGEALARVWRWDEASAAFGDAISRAGEGSTSAWRSYAVALASAGRYDEALDAAQRGLRLQPRDEGLLRVQARALSALDAEPTERDAAAAAFARHRTWDGAWAAVDACVSGMTACGEARIPVPQIELTSVP